MRIMLNKILFLFLTSQLFFARPNGYEYELENIKYDWELYELKNGLRVLLQLDENAESVSIELWTDTGSRNEQVGRLGMAHFFEHATPYGLSKKDEKRKKFLDNLINSNAQVKKDFTTYYLETSEEFLPLAIEYAADRFKVDPGEYINNQRTEYHRKNVLKEIERNSKHPGYGVNARTIRNKGTYGAHHPYGHGGYGYVPDNELITTDELIRWYRANFRPEYSTILIVGYFDPASVKNNIQEQFNEIKGGKRVSLIERRVAETRADNQRIPTNVVNYYQSITWAVPHWASVDAAALEMLSRIIDKRLKKRAELDSNLIDAGSLRDTDFYQLAGHFGVSASYKNLSYEKEVVTMLEEEVKKLLIGGVLEEELNTAKNESVKWIKEQTSKLGFIGSRTRLLGTGLLLNNDPDTYFDRLKTQLELTIEDVNKTARKYLSDSGFRLLLMPKNKSLMTGQ